MSIVKGNHAGLGGAGAPGGPLGGGAILGSYAIDQSLRVNQADDPILSYTHSASADDEGTCTISLWVKRGKLGSTTRFMGVNKGTNYGVFGFAADDTLEFQALNPTKIDFTTTRVFRDPSAWYHIVVALDIDNATSTERFKMYVNGVQETDFSTSTYPSDTNAYWNEASAKHSVGCGLNSAGDHYQEFDGYIAEVNFIDGLVLDPTSFAETIGGVWVPKEYTGSYGDEGFYLPFSQDFTAGNSISFSGTSDRVNHVNASAYDIGASDDFTIEFFFKTSEVGTGNGHLMGNYATGGPHHLITYDFRNASTRKINFYSGNGQALNWDISGDVTVSNNTWHHVVFQRNGTTLRAYIDGTRLTSVSNSSSSWSLSDGKATDFDKAYNLAHIRLGNVYTTNPIIGSISNVRYVIGNTVYADDDNDITVPTETLTAVTGTKLLTAVNSTLGDDISTENNDATTSGSPALSYDSPFTTQNFFEDASGNGNDFSVSGIAESDVLPDSPTNNFATFNPLDKDVYNAPSEGNLRALTAGNNGTQAVNFAVSSGKWYFEVRNGSAGSSTVARMVGIMYNYAEIAGASYNDSDKFVYYSDTGNIRNNSNVAYGDSWNADGDIIGVALDMDNGAMYFSKNGTWQNSATTAEIAAGTTTNAAFTGLSGTFKPIVAKTGGTSSNNPHDANFGQDSTFAGNTTAGGNADNNGIGDFKYAPPSGFLALCTANLPEPTIGPNSDEQADDYFETILYTGNDGTQHIGSGGVQHPQDTTTIANSLRFNSADSPLFSKVTGSDGNRLIWTFSAWVKRGTFPSSTIQTIFSEGSSGSSFAMHVYDNTFYVQERNSSSNRFVHQTDAVAGSAGTWYHLVYAVDTTQATDTDRVKLYVDGVLQTLNQVSSNDIYPSLDLPTNMNFGGTHYIGYGATQNKYWDGYLAEVYMIDGQQLEPTTFGQVGSNGYWIPKAVSGLTFGDEGYYLDFEDNSSASALGTDDSGVGNNFTPSAGIETSDQMLDSPTQNFVNLGPVLSLDTNGAPKHREGNLQAQDSSTAAGRTRFQLPKTGKWYFETKVTSGAGVRSGVADESVPVSVTNFMGTAGTVAGNYYVNTNGTGASINGATGVALDGGSSTFSGQPLTNPLGVIVNMDDKRISFQCDRGSGLETIGPFPLSHDKLHVGYNFNGDEVTFNFGADDSFAGNDTGGTDTADGNGYGSFFYAPPTDFLALVDDNIPQEGLESPDFVWIKERNNSSKSHYLFDTVRGVTKNLHSDDTAIEATDTDSLLSFDYQGFTVGSNGDVNGSADTYVAWNWKAGGPSPTQTYTVTVADDSGQNKYRFDGNTTFAPTLNLQEGGTYTFDWSGATTHPFSFSTTSDGTHNSGTEYTVGVVKDTDAYTTTITVAAGAPTLYYYCSVHSGMGGQANTNTTHGSSNFDGSIQSVVSANQDAGFSIVSWTGTGGNSTVGHGLSEAPELIIVKNRKDAVDWPVYNNFIGAANRLYLNTTNNSSGVSALWNSTAATNQVFSVGTSNYSNGSTDEMIAYCFHSVEGYSKVGSYVGSSDGTFVYTGFRPAFILSKPSSASGSWHIVDSTRSPSNEVDEKLYPDLSDSEGSNAEVDLLSNGFKWRGASTNTKEHHNASGVTYIYLAFAEQPFKYANAR